ncbi:hypothetical protein [Nocardioides jensenii]|uniref:hypothetical protein n=1 Tax=Nocardioides jensenii TaxID=1843 RepID=UPI0012FAE84C|nr:hypothetical protein [Nocardioides jensenii]
MQDFRPDHDGESKNVVYLSTPITTGPQLLEWLAAAHEESNRTAEVVQEEVVAENLARIGPLRSHVRAQWPDATLIDPTELNVPDWSQWEYHRFWVEIINRFVDLIVFADGWELSTGCTIEYATGLHAAIPMEDARGNSIKPADAARLLLAAADTLEGAGRDSSIALAAAGRAEREAREPLKDSSLASLASDFNVASFLSVGPGGPILRHRHIRGRKVSRSAGIPDSVQLLLSASNAGSVNVRTFKPGSPKGNPFKYGLNRVDDVLRAIQAYSASGYFCIINETISVEDGGVSGVTLGGIAEFAPDDTPRVVETAEAASLPIGVAEQILRTVYSPALALPFGANKRIEFSVHPNRVGHRAEHIIVWEVEPVESVSLDVPIVWPNRFSRLLGDKTYGLMIADTLGFPVPATTAVLRRVAPFRFGRSTGTGEWWMRTAPARQTPGHFTTTSGWSDPFALLMKEDSEADVAGVLAQEGVDALYSGATLPLSNSSDHVVEGVAGAGDGFMLGESPTVKLPADVDRRVRDLLRDLEAALGSAARIEWADDGELAWVLQLHRVQKRSRPGVFSDGAADVWISFDPSQGLDALKGLIAQARDAGAGIEVTKPIGLTSHVGDLLRRAGVPGRLADDALAGPA